MIVSVEEMRNYLRVDFEDDDALLEHLILASEKLCMDIARMKDAGKFAADKNAKTAVMYAVVYQYEHREDYYSCYATVSGESGTETSVSSLTVDNSDISFTVRFCRQTAEVTNTGFRILFQGEIYNILSVDHLNYKKKALKFKCQKVRR